MLRCVCGLIIVSVGRKLPLENHFLNIGENGIRKLLPMQRLFVGEFCYLLVDSAVLFSRNNFAASGLKNFFR
jgi:hypothetical protein